MLLIAHKKRRTSAAEGESQVMLSSSQAAAAGDIPSPPAPSTTVNQTEPYPPIVLSRMKAYNRLALGWFRVLCILTSAPSRSLQNPRWMYAESTDKAVQWANGLSYPESLFVLILTDKEKPVDENVLAALQEKKVPKGRVFVCDQTSELLQTYPWIKSPSPSVSNDWPWDVYRKGFLMLGKLSHVRNVKMTPILKDLKVSHVLSLLSEEEEKSIEKREWPELGITHKHVEVLDADDHAEELGQRLSECVAFISDAAAAGSNSEGTDSDTRPPRVLVHCNQGVSRSPAVVISFLMKRAMEEKEKDYGDAEEIFKRKHAHVNEVRGDQLRLNHGFCAKVKEWYKGQLV
uniref:protein-tyrosine-phosphatase n=1 Tax=Chromera velia CCMP2878 TaxID=1169474 RepID=A0A0G4IC30_9ALVE|eukprot:Cvel_12907.t1-p1 / transcript=Cvel_12907.t1 / gene=Cvel_12907 / organism=Chromera_velia_CCMP2878 / gene_product=hypothetical protein / transcript_product=hypothetical protein / location=Cvel_scaffold862:55175-56209(-) / protein_length=345 / sequence_SO=supercontig / SO=protein_coding / is_pseudo=false